MHGTVKMMFLNARVHALFAIFFMKDAVLLMSINIIFKSGQHY